MTGTAVGQPPARRPRRWLLALVVAAWIVVVTGLAVWSAGHDPATVPEQRDIAQVVPEMQRTVGVVFAAAGGPGRAVVLGELKLTPGCRITPVRAGVTATRDLTVYVRAGQTRADLEAIAATLPTSYRAQVADGRAGTRLDLRADAGDFIGIDADAAVAAPAFVVQVSSGCRAPAGPDAASSPGTGPGALAARAVLDDVLKALGAPASAMRPGVSGGTTGSGSASSEPARASDGGTASEVAVRLVDCPGGGTAGTYTVDGLAAPGDLGRRLRSLTAGADVVRADPALWAYRTGAASVVVATAAGVLRVSVTTYCDRR